MANYTATSLTNYFQVRDLEAFLEELSTYSFEHIEIFRKNDKLALGGYSDISIAYDEAQDEDVPLADLISNHIKKDDACIMVVGGNEKLRYVEAFSVVITAGDIRYIDSKQLAAATAARILNVDEFTLDF